MLRSRLGLLSLLCFTAARVALVAEESPPTRNPLTDVPLNPALVAYARANAIPLQGIDLSGAAGATQVGDEVTLVLSLQHDVGYIQWLARLHYDRPDAAKGEDKPLPEDKIFTSTGLELNYANTPSVLSVEFVGPFAPNTPDAAATAAPTVVQSTRVVVSAESLREGMAAYARSSLDIVPRLQAAGISQPKYSGSSTKPPAAEIQAGRKEAAAFQLTPEEERQWFSVVFSLRSFFVAAASIPGCQELMEQVIAKPSMWSFAANLGCNANFEYGWQQVEAVPADQAAVPTPAYQVPVRLYLNDKPAVKATFVATTPRPPLEATGGILAICAEHPTDKNKCLFIRVVAARPASQALASR